MGILWIIGACILAAIGVVFVVYLVVKYAEKGPMPKRRGGFGSSISGSAGS